MLARIRKAMEEKDEGFTLIELLVVIIIIGILAAIAIPIFLNQRKKAVDASIKSDLRQAANEAETYFTDAQVYALSADNAIKASANNVIEGGTKTNGYCLRGSNPNGTAGGSAAGGYYWYDSMNGGLQPGAATATTPAGCTGVTFAKVPGSN